MTGDAAAADEPGQPYGRSFLCSRWELRITERCVVDDLELAAGVSFDDALRHPIVDAFAKKRLTNTGEGKTVGPEAGAETLHHLGSGDRHRAPHGGTPKTKSSGSALTAGTSRAPTTMRSSFSSS